MEPLKECPFCGSNESLTYIEKLDKVDCGSCLITTYRSIWNTRPPTWISIKDKLPSENGRYFVVEDHYTNWLGITSFINGKFDFKITHWMPLPEPPKETE